MKREWRYQRDEDDSVHVRHAHVWGPRVTVQTSQSNQTALDDMKLISAAPELLEAQTMGSQINTPDFLDWLADRLIHVYKESPNIDFVLTLRERAKAGRVAMLKAKGE